MPTIYFYLIKNPMAFTLGLRPPHYNNDAMVQKDLTRIAQDFDLVLIAEYYDESLILLKKALCWQFKDILYLKINKIEELGARKAEISERTRKQIREWNKADQIFYDFFNKTLWKKISEYGPKFWHDLRIFREISARVDKTCSPSGFDNRAADKTLPDEKRRVFCNRFTTESYLGYFQSKFTPPGDEQSPEKLGEKFNISESSVAEKFIFDNPW